ncbi:MAG: polynucleotide kinase-phosphatase [Planctomycetota bacterium]
MNISLPNLSLVVLVGVSGSGKSSFGKRHFLDTEVISSDECRGWISDDANDQSVSGEAFELLEFIVRKRLAHGRLTVIDATNLEHGFRQKWVRLAREFHVLPVAIVLNIDEKICAARNETRPDRNFGAHVLRRQQSSLRRSLYKLKKEGFRYVFRLDSESDVDACTIERTKLWNDRTELTGPFDVIGDVHGCCEELQSLLETLGYERYDVPKEPGWATLCYRHPEHRRATFVGDLVDRGPQSLNVLSLVRNMVMHDDALCVPGNHDVKLLRKLSGKNVQVRHGLAQTLEDLATVPESEQPEFNQSLIEFLDSMVSHLVLDRGKLVVAHAGLPESMHGRASGRVREFALYGATTGERDEYGLPVRLNWAADYRGDAMVVYGHTPVAKTEWLNHTINLDTGCVFGRSLTALRYPELETVSVPALKTYYESPKPIVDVDELSAQQSADDVLDAKDVMGKRVISTRLRAGITVREENATAALEVMSRFAIDTKWLVYLPPTMSPAETSRRPGFLEHPDETFTYYRERLVSKVVCQEKHMGSRAIVVVTKGAETARRRFGVTGDQAGVIYTRTGRPFFNSDSLEHALLARLQESMSRAGFWDQHQTDWACFDCELMPWSAKAQELLKTQYAAVAAAASSSIPVATEQLKTTQCRLDTIDAQPNTELQDMLQRLEQSSENIDRFRQAYRQYCWEVDSEDDFKIAPFHLLATENASHTDKDHHWHLDQISNVVQHDPVLMVTRSKTVDLDDATSQQEVTDWWLEMTAQGGEGMVVKPLSFIHHSKRKERPELIQPAIKCRGKEYLRIIYGANYDVEENLKRLRQRHLGRKRSLALREFALGVESIERFVAKKPLRRIHECVFAVLALESEPVDPRL